MINPLYFSETLIGPFSSSFRSRRTETKLFDLEDSSSTSSASITTSVFPLALWPHFLDPKTCHDLQQELAQMNFSLRSSDLYEFHQTKDLKQLHPSTNPLIAQLCNELYSEQFLKVMERITGRRLGTHVDISGQRYQRGDFLLCHDDRLEKRRIALILYLIEKDSDLQGGRLFALRSDEEGRPVLNDPQIVTPQWNTLAFFEVSRSSFHQVEQIYSEQVPRYSVTCWFHDADADEEEETTREEEGYNHNKNNSQLQIPDIFPIKFNCTLTKPLDDLIKDFESLSRPIFREYADCNFLSLAQYTTSHEPQWISHHLQDSFHRFLERLSGCLLDWPTRPVAWCLTQPHHFFIDNGVDRQQDVEYNYKTRTPLSSNSKTEKLILSLFLRFPKNSNSPPLKPFYKLHRKPLNLPRLPPAYRKLIVVTMKFDIVAKDHRSLN